MLQIQVMAHGVKWGPRAFSKGESHHMACAVCGEWHDLFFFPQEKPEIWILSTSLNFTMLGAISKIL